MSGEFLDAEVARLTVENAALRAFAQEVVHRLHDANLPYCLRRICEDHKLLTLLGDQTPLLTGEPQEGNGNV